VHEGAGADPGTLTALAEQALARLAPLRFDVARDEQERDAVLRMRFECVVAEGWARREDLPAGRERDAYDEQATFVVCRDGERLAGSMRVVAPSPGRVLPSEQEFGVRARPAGGVVEVGRLIVAPDLRPRQGHRILAGLAARGWLEAVARRYERAISSATPELVELYRGLGLRVTVLGPARDHWGARRVPIMIQGDDRSFAFLTRADGDG
jgi:N-acyl-L-homoserine lactone synthetase